MHPERTPIVRGAGRIVADEPAWLRRLLIGLAVGVVGCLVILPVAYIFVQALAPGFDELRRNLWDDADTRHAIVLTLLLAPAAVVLNTVFGIAAAWAIARFRFPGRTLLVTLLDLPFAISPVVAGLMFVLLFGMQGWFGPALREANIKIIFAWPGLLIATTFVTMPFVARELLPLMEALGDDEDLAAVNLGANAWQLFTRVTLPNIKWGLLFGVIQCFARAIGEFGAVAVVSGHVAGETETMALRVERLFQDYNNPGSYAVAALLTLMALATLVGKIALEHASARDGSEELQTITAAEPIAANQELADVSSGEGF